ncbi:MAG: molybdopterin molybdenumtransferase MoeA [Verrucomicrobiales bacterium]|nr:molybdopterin molybdenumtransferase MoeA [Verrucomicrobiales bacterium]|tara:strand:- start:8823 stop:10001 length:1179 start_codon:yes stop_codon:yes gene_type:complete
MIELEEATTRILKTIRPTEQETIPLANAAGRILAASQESPVNLPAFDNSAMDGYAVRAADAATGARLRQIGEVPAGAFFAGAVREAQCVRIYTGSPIPAGANAVVMQEDTQMKGDTIEITEGVKPFEHIRLQGEDVREGETIGRTGEKLHAGRLQLLGAAGVARVETFRRPIVGVLATGDELREPGMELGEGGIYESNRVALAELIRQAGAEARVFPLVPDTLEATVDALGGAFAECDAVVTSGGVSVGEHDYVKAAFEKLGGSLDFWRVKIKPGKPFVFGRLDDRPLFGVPGNPVSAMVTFLVLVRPAVLQMQGATTLELPSHPGVLADPLANRGDRRHFMRVRVDTQGTVHATGLQASHAVAGLGQANGLVDVTPKTVLGEGEHVDVLRF